MLPHHAYVPLPLKTVSTIEELRNHDVTIFMKYIFLFLTDEQASAIISEL